MATISKVLIANMALSNLGGRSKIESFTEQSVEAAEVNLWYDYSRLATLQAFNWSFATKRLALALDSNEAPLLEWTYRYQYPSDCVRARYIENPSGPWEDVVPFKVEMADATTKTILTDMEDATLVYTFDQENTSFFTPLFVKAMSFHLASQLAMPITGKVALQDNMFEKWLFHVNMAAAHDANESGPRAPRDGDSVRARGYNTTNDTFLIPR